MLLALVLVSIAALWHQTIEKAEPLKSLKKLTPLYMGNSVQSESPTQSHTMSRGSSFLVEYGESSVENNLLLDLDLFHFSPFSLISSLFSAIP